MCWSFASCYVRSSLKLLSHNSIRGILNWGGPDFASLVFLVFKVQKTDPSLWQVEAKAVQAQVLKCIWQTRHPPPCPLCGLLWWCRHRPWTDIGLCMGPCSLLILPKRRRILHRITFNRHKTVLRPGKSQEGVGQKKRNKDQSASSAKWRHFCKVASCICVMQMLRWMIPPQNATLMQRAVWALEPSFWIFLWAHAFKVHWEASATQF